MLAAADVDFVAKGDQRIQILARLGDDSEQRPLSPPSNEHAVFATQFHHGCRELRNCMKNQT